MMMYVASLIKLIFKILKTRILFVIISTMRYEWAWFLKVKASSREKGYYVKASGSLIGLGQSFMKTMQRNLVKAIYNAHKRKEE
jgi:hypothetical protein